MAITKYADIITRIAMVQGMVRMDLGTVALETVSKDGQARLDVDERICMPLTGFLRTYQEMTGLVQNLKSQGIITDAAAKDAGAAASVGAAGADVGTIDSNVAADAGKADKKSGKKDKA